MHFRSSSSNLRSIRAALISACLITLVITGSAIAAQPERRSSSFVQAATGSVYWQNEPAQQWQHRDTAELSAGHRVGNWLDAELTWSIRTDVSTKLAMETRLRLLRLGPASLRLKALGSVGAGLENDIWFSRMAAGGPELELQLAGYTLNAYGVAGLYEKSPWHFNSMDSPFAEAGIALKPAPGRAGITIGASYTATESPASPDVFAGTWNGNLGFRWAL